MASNMFIEDENGPLQYYYEYKISNKFKIKCQNKISLYLAYHNTIDKHATLLDLRYVLILMGDKQCSTFYIIHLQ